MRTYRVFNRRYRNRRIGDFLKEMHLTEGRNTGFRKILNALERNGSPAPIFETDPERLSFCTTILIHHHFLSSNGDRNEDRKMDRRGMTLSAITENPYITMDTLVENLGFSKSTVYRILKDLKAEGFIKREGSTKKGRWVVL